MIADLGDLKELRQECHQEPNPHNGQVDRLAPLHQGKDLIFLMDHKACHGEECDHRIVPQTCGPVLEDPLDHQE